MKRVLLALAVTLPVLTHAAPETTPETAAGATDTAATAASAATAAPAEVTHGYVVDRFQIGVHESPDPDSAILELVASGTPLDVIGHEAGAAHVRTASGTTGWVDENYVTANPPAAQRVEDAQNAAAAARNEVTRLQKEVADAGERARAAEERARAAEEAESERTRAAQQTAAATSDTLRELQKLAEENQTLKQRIAEIEAVRAMSAEHDPPRAAAAPASPAAPAPAEPAPTGPLAAALAGTPYELFARWERWVWLLAASLTLLGFGLGAWVVDWGVRRRHGGFRL